MSSTILRNTLVTAGLAAALALPARAQFVGEYLFTGSSGYLYSGDGSEYGQWTVEAAMDGDGTTEGAIWTDGLPASVILQADARTTDLGGATVRMTTTASVSAGTAGTISFTVSFETQGNQSGGFYYSLWDIDGNRHDSPVYTDTQSFSISLQPLEGFAFNVFAEDLTALSDDHDFFSATISDFSFTPVPEPASAAALTGLGALGGAALRRRRPLGARPADLS